MTDFEKSIIVELFVSISRMQLAMTCDCFIHAIHVCVCVRPLIA